MPIDSWKPEPLDALRDYVAGHLHSYAEIARAINEQFNTTFSRNACIGKAERMGFVDGFSVPRCAPQKPKEPKQPKKPRDRKRQGDHHAVMKIVAGGHGSTRVIQSSESAEIANLRCVEIIPLNLTLAELDQAAQCHYIPGDDLLYCGHPKREGSAYCTPHHFLCLGDPPKPRRDVIMRRDAA